MGTETDAGIATPSACERSLALAGVVVAGRYQVTAVAAVRREVVVYHADDVRTGRPITLEVVRDEPAADAEFVAAVRVQAYKLAASAHVHRGVARVYDCGTTETGEVFVALERSEGPTLREILDSRGSLDTRTALRLAGQIGEALETLHHEDIAHGQLGPDCVVVATDAHGPDRVSLIGVELTAAYRTRIGRLMREASPPPYLAPEQIERGETTEASDVYALGNLLAEMLTARKAGSTIDPAADTAKVPAPIDRIIATAVDPRPYRRYPDISVMLNDMWGVHATLAESEAAEPSAPLAARPANAARHLRAGPPRAMHRIGMVAATAVVVAAVIWGTLSWRATAPPPAGPSVPVSATATPRGSSVTPSPAPTIPVSAGSARPRPVPVAPSVPVARVTPPVPQHTADAVSDGPAAAVAAPPPTPTGVRTAPSRAMTRNGASRVESAAQRPTTPEPRRDVGDGDAAIDWLLRQRR